MIDGIKDSLKEFEGAKSSGLSIRDKQGIAKIHFELDLLKEGHEKKPKKSSASRYRADSSDG